MKPNQPVRHGPASPKGVFAERKHHKPRLALNNITAGVRGPSEWSGGPSDIDGKATRVGASECGQRMSFNRTREAGHLDEIQGVVANTLKLHRNRAIGFIDQLDAALELRTRRGRRLTPRGRGYSWSRCVTLPGKAFLQLIRDSLFDHVLNGIGKRR
jgi:hypothetical protein